MHTIIANCSVAFFVTVRKKKKKLLFSTSVVYFKIEPCIQCGKITVFIYYLFAH